MFKDPDLNDYIGWVRHHLDEHADLAVKAVNKVRAQAAATSSLQSGRTIIYAIEAVQQEYEKGIDFAFGTLRWAIKESILNEDQLRDSTVQLLENFRIQSRAICEIPEIKIMGSRAAVDEKLQKFDEKLTFLIRHFDVGFYRPKEQSMTKVDNSINIQSMTASAIQHSSPGASQSPIASVSLNDAKIALAAFEAAIASIEAVGSGADDLKADIQTIRAQLEKAKPSISILNEAGKSARSIVEGIASSWLTPPVIAAAPALWSALGLG